MTEVNVIRIMEPEHLYEFPEVREEYEENANKGNYFFFVILDTEGEIIGYLIAKGDERKRVFVKNLRLFKDVKNRYAYVNVAIYNLFCYIKQIKNPEGERIYTKVI